MSKSVDQNSIDLARYFLGDAASDSAVQSLAEVIQASAEHWLDEHEGDAK